MAKILLYLYQLVFLFLSPLLKIVLQWRVTQGKEIASRLNERYGQVTVLRPSGKIAWFHGASVGEILALLPLLENLNQSNHPFIVTTGTVSAAQILTKKMPGILHQFIPMDQVFWVKRFIDFWQPSVVVWAESEFWPTFLNTLKKRHIPVILLNGGISAKSLKRWKNASSLLKMTLKNFTKSYGRSVLQIQRLKKAGLGSLMPISGNIKFLAQPLTYENSSLQQLKSMINNRPVWLAVSTHSALSKDDQDEEVKITRIHQELIHFIPDILTIIVPRHPLRREAILRALPLKENISCRSLKQPITANTQIYLADTLGELGLFFQLSTTAFIGGSLVPQGGHNLLEPLQLGIVPLSGPYIHNSQEIFDILEEPWIIAQSEEELYQKTLKLLTDKTFCRQLHEQLIGKFRQQQQQLELIFDAIIADLHKILT